MRRETQQTILVSIALVACGLALYAGTLDAPFVFDDVPSIVENPNIEALWPPSRSFGAPPGAGSSGRPLVSFSLALNYALGGREVLGYHLFNVATLILGALALFGVARRSLAGGAHAGASFGLALAIAGLWLVHPLHTDTLNHVVYRNGSMMAMFYLASLYAALRAFEEPGARCWSLACVASAAAAMASKEVAVSLPLAVLALDRQVGAGSFRAALGKRPGLYAGLAATWGLLACCVLTGDRGESVGYGHSEVIDAVDSLRTQMVALAVYLRTSFLAAPLVFDYHGQEVMRSWAEVGVEAALFGALFVASLLGFARRRAAGLLGLACFAILAPTSSVVPLAGELVAEHRMTLPLAPLVALVVLGAWRLLARFPAMPRWLAPALALVAAGLLSWKTVERNRDYASALTLWQDTVDKRPENPRAWNHLGIALQEAGRDAEAEAAFRRSLELDPDHGRASYNFGNLLFARGDLDGALERFAHAARFAPKDAYVRFNHGYALVQSGRAREGLAEYRAALELRPGWARASMLTSWLLATSPDDSLRDGAEALRLARELNEASGHRLPRHLDTLAAALAESGDLAGAARVAAEAVAAARGLGNGPLAAEIEARRALYASGAPYREGD